MIKLVRLDERLLHGQVATKLLNTMDVDTAVVIDDETAADEFATKLLLMAVVGAGVSGRVKTSIKPLETAIRMLNDPRCEKKKILIVMRDIEGLLRVVKEVPGIDEINVANYGHIMESKTPRKRIAASLSLNEEEAAILKEIMSTGRNVYYQQVLESEKINLKCKL